MPDQILAELRRIQAQIVVEEAKHEEILAGAQARTNVVHMVAQEVANMARETGFSSKRLGELCAQFDALRAQLDVAIKESADIEIAKEPPPVEILEVEADAGEPESKKSKK